MDAVENFQHCLNSFFAVRLKFADFCEGLIKVKAEGRFPDDRWQRLK